VQQRFEYRFVRIKVGIFRNHAEQEYRETVHRHAREGWRLVTIFAPSLGVYGVSTYYELIFERPVETAFSR